jgi:hypothetical protein
MKQAKTILFSTLEATIFYLACLYLVVDVLNLKDVLFWFSFILFAVAFSWMLSRRTHFWMLKLDDKWCPDNRWYYHHDKNYAIYDRWQGVIKQGEKDCINRMENLQS